MIGTVFEQGFLLNMHAISSSRVRIGDHFVGDGAPCFIMAEIGVNHNGNMDLARQLIVAAAAAGVDAVKFQAFSTEELITPETRKAGYQLETTGESGGQQEMLKALELTADQHGELKEACDSAGLVYSCTPYDLGSLKLLDRLDTPVIKVASTDTTNLPFLRQIASVGRPVVLSTGMCSLSQIEEAYEALAPVRDRLIILHCTSEYPAPPEEANLRVIHTIRQAFGCPTGYSDHTPGVGLSPWAVVAGACFIEKHFTLDRSLTGPDHRASIEPDELRELVDTVRLVEKAMGDGVKRPSPSELANVDAMRKSVVARRDISAGSVINEKDLVCKRPGTGLAPKWIERIVGCRAVHDIPAESIIQLNHVDWIES